MGPTVLGQCAFSCPELWGRHISPGLAKWRGWTWMRGHVPPPSLSLPISAAGRLTPLHVSPPMWLCPSLLPPTPVSLGPIWGGAL